MDGLEAKLREKYPTTNRKGQQFKVNLIRFADDFIVTGNSKELLENEIVPLVKTFLEERGLELSLEKTDFTHIDDGFDFLGQNIRKYKGKLLIKPAPKNIKAFLNKARKVIQTSGSMRAGHKLFICYNCPVSA